MEKIKIENGRQTAGYMTEGKVLRVIRDAGHYFSIEKIYSLADEQEVEEIVIYDRNLVGVCSYTYTKVDGKWKDGYWWGGEFVEA